MTRVGAAFTAGGGGAAAMAAPVMIVALALESGETWRCSLARAYPAAAFGAG